MKSTWRLVVVCVSLLGALAACGDDSPLDRFLPAVPEPDGTPRSTFAGVVAGPADLVAGPAQSGVIGDYYLRNDKAHFVVQSTERVIGIIPWGGNLVDGALVGSEDHVGEVSLVYQLGRTCAHETMSVLRDGSGGGPAVVRAIGRAAPNDGINIRGIGELPVPPAIDPDVDDGVLCATTYTLRPGATHLEVAWTLYNPGDTVLRGPLGVLSDVGGEIEAFVPRQGFQGIGGSLGDIFDSQGDSSAPYIVYQAPGAAWGIVPRIGDLRGVPFIVSGASFMVFGIQQFLDVLDPAKHALAVPAEGGITYAIDVVVGRDGGAVEAELRRGEALGAVTGQVPMTAGRPRVTFFADEDGVSGFSAGDVPVFYLDAAEDGTISGRLPPGEYLARAEVPDLGAGAVTPVTVTEGGIDLEMQIPAPARIDYSVVDAAAPAGGTIPAKLTLIGRHPVPPDARTAATSERRFGVVRVIHAAHGTSSAAGTDPEDPPLLVPAGGPYRLFVSRGPEWSLAVVDLPAVTAGQALILPPIELERVLDTSGYLATAFHEHAIASPDSAVPLADRVRSLAVEGIELFAGTDHDRLVDYTPVIAALGLESRLAGVTGVETSPFSYGHFIGFPVTYDAAHPAGGAFDWARGTGGPEAQLPREIFASLRQIGARVVQVCHPRGERPGLGTFQEYFERAALTFDFVARTASGIPASQEIPSDWLRLPVDEPFYADDFDAIEVWNSFGQNDDDADGRRDFTLFDKVLRDWMNYLSLGKLYTPMANADTHGGVSDAAGLPRTLVAVSDDGVGAATEEVWNTLSGGLPRDLVLTNGPMVRVTSGGAPLLGRVVTGPVTLTIDVSAAAWVDFDTVEIFANQTFATMTTPLVPTLCYTTRNGLPATDPCAKGGARAMTVRRENSGAGGDRLVARIEVALAAADVPHPGTGDDAWVVVRVRGNRGLFPVIAAGILDDVNLDAMTTGNSADRDAALVGRGVTATALTAPIFIDFDGGGYRAPFQP